MKRREVKNRAEKETYPFECRVPRIARRGKKAFFSDQRKEIQGNKMVRLEMASRKLEIPREHFMQRWAQ